MSKLYDLMYSMIGVLNKTIRTDAQVLTVEQKTQARANIGALPDTYVPPNQTAEQVGADPKGTAANAVSAHNVSDDAHEDIRLLISQLATKVNNFLDSDDTTLDELSELIQAIKDNAGTIEQMTSGKVNVADIINNLATNVANKPLSAAQGVVLKGLIDTLSSSLSEYALTSEVPTKVSQLTNDAGYLTEVPDGYATEQWVQTGYQPKGNYLTEHQDISGKADTVYVDEQIADVKSEIVQQSPLFANSIEECTDTSKVYVLPDGYIYAYMSVTGALHTNLLSKAIGADGEPYNGELGYKMGWRMGMSVPGNVFEGSAGFADDNPGGILTGMFAYDPHKTKVIRISGCTKSLTNMCSIVFFDGNYVAIANQHVQMNTYVSNYAQTYADEPAFDNSVKTFTFDIDTYSTETPWYSSELKNNTKYVAFSLGATDVSKLVVTFDEEIAFGVESKWMKTGHQFVPADCEERIIPLEETSKNHETRIRTLEMYGSESTSSVDIPVYIKEEANNVLDRLIEKQGNRVFNMIAMSDFHYSNYAGEYGGADDDNRVTLLSVAKAASYMLDRVHIDAVATLGDNTPFGAVTDRQVWWAHRFFKEINEILTMTQRPGVVDFRTVGNHDRMGGNDSDGNPTPIMPDGAIYQYIQGYNRQCDYLSAPVGYGYKDFEGYKLRVIVLNTAECEGKGRFDSPHFGHFVGNAQYNWLINNALDMSSKPDASEWQILILSHHRADDVQVATDGNSWGHDAYILPNVLNAYKTGGSYSGVIAEEGISVSCNFAGKNQARLIGQIHGHHHGYKFYNLYLGAPENSTQTDIMAIGTPTTSYGTTNPDNDGNTYTSTEKGTAEETTFCVYAIDLDEHKIYSINYGRGIDREISY